MSLVLFQRCGTVHVAGVFCCTVMGMYVSLVLLQSAGLMSLVLLLECGGPEYEYMLVLLLQCGWPVCVTGVAVWLASTCY